MRRMGTLIRMQPPRRVRREGNVVSFFTNAGLVNICISSVTSPETGIFLARVLEGDLLDPENVSPKPARRGLSIGERKFAGYADHD